MWRAHWNEQTLLFRSHSFRISRACVCSKVEANRRCRHDVINSCAARSTTQRDCDVYFIRIKCNKKKNNNKIDNYECDARWKSMRHLLDQYRFRSRHCQPSLYARVCRCSAALSNEHEHRKNTQINNSDKSTEEYSYNFRCDDGEQRQKAGMNTVNTAKQSKAKRKMYRNQPTIFISFQSI